MEDAVIINLYFDRSEKAIQATEEKYSRYCFSIAWNILYDKEDSDECVNDTWLAAWSSIPPRKSGEEVLTYTEGVGWQEKETKAESQVHSALKLTYYEAFCDARKVLNSEQRTGGMNENIMSQGNFDMKA